MTTKTQRINRFLPRMAEEVWHRTIRKDGHGIATLDRAEACTQVGAEGCTPAEEVEHPPCAGEVYLPYAGEAYLHYVAEGSPS